MRNGLAQMHHAYVHNILKPMISKVHLLQFQGRLSLVAIAAVQRAGFERPSKKNVRDLARNMEYTNVNHKACFAGSERKILCIKPVFH